MSEEHEKKDNESESNQQEPDEESTTKLYKNVKPVVLSAEAYKTIILYASRYANQSIPSKNWKEIYGILIGRRDNDFVFVERAEALTFGHDTDVELDHRHLGFIATIEDDLYAEGSGQYIVGWFHSHPGLGLFFSYTDLKNQLFFQTHEDGIGLVFDHTLLGKKKEVPILDEEGKEHKITKLNTGFEIYRITNISMDVNDPEFDENYHQVDCIIKGFNKYFFANVLAELSALVSAGKPLQSAYGEERISNIQERSYHQTRQVDEDFITDIDLRSGDDRFLVDIPMSEDIQYSTDKLYQEKVSKEVEMGTGSKITAEKLIYEGNMAFKDKDTFTGIEKYQGAIEIYKKLKDHERVLDLLRNLAKVCVSENHHGLAEDYAKQLFDLAKSLNNTFYIGIANYINGYVLLKKGDNSILKEALSKIRDAAVAFENVKDYEGAGMCFSKIGVIYQTRLENFDSACLFLKESIVNYNKAIKYSHPLRKSIKSKPELLSEKVVELRDLLEELLPNIENEQIKLKIRNDLDTLEYNF